MRPATIVALALTACSVASSAAGGPADSLRLQAIEPDCFDYVFTSVSRLPGGKTVLAFNSRAGRTFFVREGEEVGEYSLVDYSPAAGSTTLRGPDGDTTVLKQGERFVRDGWRAKIVDHRSAKQWSVRKGDLVVRDNAAFQVVGVTEDSASIRLGSTVVELPWLSSEEKQQVVRLRKGRREAAMAARVQAAQAQRVDVHRPQIIPGPIAGPVIAPILAPDSFEVRNVPSHAWNPALLYPPRIFTFDENGRPTVIPLYSLVWGAPQSAAPATSGAGLAWRKYGPARRRSQPTATTRATSPATQDRLLNISVRN